MNFHFPFIHSFIHKENNVPMRFYLSESGSVVFEECNRTV